MVTFTKIVTVGGVKEKDSGYILFLKLTKYANRLDKWNETKRRNSFKSLV